MSVSMRIPSRMGRREREPVTLPGSVVLRTGRSIPVTLVDMSVEGCRVECAEILPIAATVRLEVGGGIANAQVRWALPGAAGLQLI